jgi:hypothetical protein
LEEGEKAGLRWDCGANKMELMYHSSVISSPFIQSLNNRKIKLKIKKIPTTFIQSIKKRKFKFFKKFQQHSYNY